MADVSLNNRSLSVDDAKPKMLDHYDRAMFALTAALESTQVDVVLASRADLDHIKLRARQIRDRALLADATEFQMRVERHLGVLLNSAQSAGQLYSRGRPDNHEQRTKLSEIGVDRKLSMKARQAAAMDQQAFDTVVSDMRAHMAGGSAKIVSAINGTERRKRKSADHSSPREASSFSFQLADGTAVGAVKVGKLKSRIDRLVVEFKMLTAINDRIGSGADTLASVEESISEVVLRKIIELATAKH